MENREFPREISLCLSGGAARGAFHLGAISVLQEQGVAIKAISGTSIGALIGASLASGKSALEIYEVITSKEFRKVFRFNWFRGYIFELDDTADVVDKLVDRQSFEELLFPLSVAVCDLEDEDIKYFDSGDDFRKLVLASCSLAPFFKPVELHDKIYVDGGFIDNFPVEQLQKHGYPIVGINLYPKYKKRVSSMFGWMKKVFYVAWQYPNFSKAKLCDIYMCSDEIADFKVLSLRDIDKAYELGRMEMSKYFSKGLQKHKLKSRKSNKDVK